MPSSDTSMTDSLKRSKAVAEVRSNRLVITFADTITKQDMGSLYTDVRFCVADLKFGFSVISDFSRSHLIHLNSVPTCRKIVHYLISNGVGEVVRIVQQDRLVYKQILNLALKVSGYKSLYVPTFDEAVERLDQIEKRDGLRLSLRGVKGKYQAGILEGVGEVLDVSTSGCALVKVSQPVTVGEEILLALSLVNEEESMAFQFRASVVRATGDSFAVAFIGVDGEQKEKLWNGLLLQLQVDGE